MASSPRYPLLETIDGPADLRELSEASLSVLADELRDFLIHSVCETGGHLAASLGTVELTIALHYIYNTPDDRLVWDVGHQTYAHKILTGRREQMQSLRQKNGLSGFPRRDESPFDTFGVGHSSTSVSAALGMAVGGHLAGKQRKNVAVIGDGAMTAGMAFEALNHAGDMDPDLLVILNDNDMSISPNVGGLSNYLGRVLSGKLYMTIREEGKRVLRHAPGVSKLARLAEEHVKGMVVPGTLFEELGVNYIGPIDGHDVHSLLRTLRNIHGLSGVHLLHVVTRKGKGYAPAEEKPVQYHGVPKFDPATGKLETGSSSGPSYTQVFSDWICDMAEQDPRLVAITPAMREGSGLVAFSERFPERYHDVGIAEQHSLTFAAGLACEGAKPVVAIYSTFLQRAYDQLIHDIAIQNLPVLFAIDRAGLVGADGATHAGSFDLSYLRCIPNMVVMAPSDINECRQMLYTGFQHDGPAAVRYPRGGDAGRVEIEAEMTALPLGRAEVRRTGARVALLSFGSLLEAGLEAAERLDASVVNMRFIKPLDLELLREIADSHELLVTLEDNVVMGGAGSAVNEALVSGDARCRILNLGLPDYFVEHGGRDELLADCGLDADSIYQRIVETLDQTAGDSSTKVAWAANSE